MSNKTQTSFRLSDDHRSRLKKEAKKQDRSINKIVERLIEKYLPKL